MKRNHTSVNEKSKMLVLLKFAAVYQVYHGFMSEHYNYSWCLVLFLKAICIK